MLDARLWLLLMKRGLYFSTKKNNYFYDDTTGNVAIVKGDLPENTIMYGDSDYVPPSVYKTDIEYHIHQQASKILTLVVTEDCNFRCKYCVYSDNYTNTRAHEKKFMQSDIAFEAVDKYLNHFNSYNNINPITLPKICFFGGEPLINFKLIKEVVQRAKQLYSGKILFLMTTNASLLTNDKIDFLMENDFYLTISLNGDKQEHDRMRVYSNGRGTYDDIIKKLYLIREKNIDYYIKNLSIINVYDTGTDMQNLRGFYKEGILQNKLAKLSPVLDTGTNWYQQYSEEEKNKFKDSNRSIIEECVESIKLNKEMDDVSRLVFMNTIFNIMNRPINVPIENIKYSFLPYTGTCFPGMKIVVDTKGLLHSCEKINEKMPIGNVRSWVDARLIEKIITKYNDTMGPKCVNCPVQRLCEVCYQHVLDENGEFSLHLNNNICDNLIKRKQEAFSFLYGIMEDGISFNELSKSLTKKFEQQKEGELIEEIL